jgi:translation initiation factor 2B subunit (eIF-2B alpha/beta/delta family)
MDETIPIKGEKSHGQREEKQQWEGWLDDNFGPRLVKIREAVQKLHEENEALGQELPHYTPHGKTHCQAVENLIHRLIPGDRYKKLKIEERFYLLASAWLHDVGMHKIVAEVVWGKHLSPVEIRKRHHLTSEKFIMEHSALCCVREMDRACFSLLARYHRHREDLNKLEEIITIGNVDCRLRLMAAYIRLADALHIDATRAPDSAYSLCLAYDMPTESKFHWVKSKLVNGVSIDAKDHKIVVNFLVPRLDEEKEVGPDKVKLEKKISKLIDTIAGDIRTELATVMNTLTRTGISYYLDIVKSTIKVVMPERARRDLLQVIANYDIIEHPSASKLLGMIFTSISGILGFDLNRKYEVYKVFEEAVAGKGLCDGEDYELRKHSIEKILNEMENELKRQRPRHTGLLNILSLCQHLNSNCFSTRHFVFGLNKLYINHHQKRDLVRENANRFFSRLEIVKEDIHNDQNKDKSFINILLYGYSELAIIALCGLRDYILINKYGITNIKDGYYKVKHRYYNSRIEKEVSENNIRIFICDGQPKTHSEYSDRLCYHDGIAYANTLTELNFGNIVLIPDIVVETIMPKIHYVITGIYGYGIDKTTNSLKYVHSAGHNTVLNIANSLDKNVIMALTMDKYDQSLWDVPIKTDCQAKENLVGKDYVENDGFKMWKGYSDDPIRANIWLARDSEKLEQLRAGEVMLFNPREDTFRFNRPNHFVISDCLRTYKCKCKEQCTCQINCVAEECNCGSEFAAIAFEERVKKYAVIVDNKSQCTYFKHEFTKESQFSAFCDVQPPAGS